MRICPHHLCPPNLLYDLLVISILLWLTKAQIIQLFRIFQSIRQGLLTQDRGVQISPHGEQISCWDDKLPSANLQ
jgi:hypothetical protein